MLNIYLPLAFLDVPFCLLSGCKLFTNLSNKRVSSCFTRSSSSLVKVQLQDEVAILELNRKPVNSFSLEFLEEINTTLSDLENNRDIRGLIVTSVSYLTVLHAS
jgi:hypothetical protein